MVAYLARCQLDPAMPRASIETLLHAFVPAPHVHHTHPDGINVLAGTRRRRAARARVLRRRGGLDPLHPPGLHALQAGRRGGARATRACSSSCSPSTASSSGATRPRRPTARRSRSSTGRSRSSTSARRATRRFGGPAGAALDDATAPRDSCTQLLPAIRGAVSSRAREAADASTRRRRRSSSCPRARRRELVTVGAPCPDHLVHTKRVPLWIPFDPATDDVDDAARAHSRARRGLPRGLPRLRRRIRGDDDRARATRTRASCSSSTSASSASARR